MKLMSFFMAIISFFSVLFGCPGFIYKDESVNVDDYKLVWNDEFNGSLLDLTKWRVHRHDTPDITGSTVRRGSYYNIAMCSVEDGALHIATKYYENGIFGIGKPGWYTCALDTHNSFQSSYGYYECRCILPKGVGLWSAFWIYSGAVGNIDGTGKDGAEIDIFESAYYGNKRFPNSVSSAIHYDGYGKEHQSKTICWTRLTDNNPYEEFNNYGLKWAEDGYTFYINGREVAKTTYGGVCEVKEDIIISVEVGGENATPAESWAGDSIDTNTIEPTDFIVDYVRVYDINK